MTVAENIFFNYLEMLKISVLKLKNNSTRFKFIQQTADRVARGAGSAFRVVAGTQSIDSAIKNLNPDADVQSDDGSSEKRSARSGDLSLVKILL